MQDAIESRVATVESDSRRVHEEDKAADAQLRGALNALSAVLSAGHDHLANSIAALSSRRPSTRLSLKSKSLGCRAAYVLSEGVPTVSARPRKSSGILSSGLASP